MIGKDSLRVFKFSLKLFFYGLTDGFLMFHADK